MRGADYLRTPSLSIGHAVVRGSAFKGSTGDKGSSSTRHYYGQNSPDEHYYHGQQSVVKNGDVLGMQRPLRDAPRPSASTISSIPVPITNTNRATISQVKARKRLQQGSQKSPSEVPPRRILNYARGGDDGDER